MITRWFISIILNAIALLIVDQLFTSFYMDGFVTALIASVILALLNTIVKPILVFFTLPITFMTLGLFMFIINAITLMITQSLMGSSFVIEGFGTAILAAIVLSVINSILNRFVKKR